MSPNRLAARIPTPLKEIRDILPMRHDSHVPNDSYSNGEIVPYLMSFFTRFHLCVPFDNAIDRFDLCHLPFSSFHLFVILLWFDLRYKYHSWNLLAINHSIKRENTTIIFNAE